MGEADGDHGGVSGGDRHFVGHARTVMALTLVSRVSGMVRDAVCSRVFGLSPAWSAFATAFIVPNVFRRLFGEGALSAAFIPEYAQVVERDPELADRLATLTVSLVLAVLGVVVLLIEVALGLVLLGPLSGEGGHETTRDVVVLMMVMLPFAPLVCATAMLGGMLQTHGRFVPHAASPVILNLCMIVAAALFAFVRGSGLRETALAVAVGVLVAGVLQLAWCAFSLRGVVRWRRASAGVWVHARSIARRLGPVMIGMGTLQLGTLMDGLIAGWPVIVGRALPGGAVYPLDEGAQSTLFFANRLYQFPLGVFGIAVATAVFPALSRQWREPSSFMGTLRRGMRLSLFIGIPATVGLLLVARDATAVIFLGGAFGESELDRVTRALLAYAPAVWAYSLTHVLTRAFYATGDTKRPMRVGVATVGTNLTLNLTLMWPLAEAGLALATSIAAVGQCAVLSLLAASRLGRGGGALLDTETRRSIAWCVASAAAMAGAVLVVRVVLPLDGVPGWWGYTVSLARDVVVGGGTYGVLAIVSRRAELGWLLERGGGGGNGDSRS